MRSEIRNTVESIAPLDQTETDHRADVLAWIDSGADLFRLEKPALPPKHLVSYFVVVDADHYLLVHHRNAQLWLPTGGHVNPGEHPRDTVIREAAEELNIKTELIEDTPILVTCTETSGLTAGHVDVSLWYALQGDRERELDWDRGEFLDVEWFESSTIPYSKSDPHMQRFITKFQHTR